MTCNVALCDYQVLHDLVTYSNYNRCHPRIDYQVCRPRPASHAVVIVGDNDATGDKEDAAASTLGRGPGQVDHKHGRAEVVVATMVQP